MFGHRHGRAPPEEESFCLFRMRKVRVWLSDYLLTSFDKVAGCDQPSVTGTDNYSFPDITEFRLVDLALGLNDTVSVQSTDQTMGLVVGVAFT